MSTPLNAQPRVFLAGHRGMVGAAIARALQHAGARAPLTADRTTLDLRDAALVRAFLRQHRPQHVYIAAATVGGILANDTRPAEFIADNLAIALNLIDAAHYAGVERLLFLGSSCIYPRLAAQPMNEEALLTGALEPTNEAYALAKIAGIKLCESYNRQYGNDFRSLMPTNLYGPGDNFDPRGSHVIPGLLRRFHEARMANAPEVVVWGTGTPKREFLHVDDLARACVHVMGLEHKSIAAVTEPQRSQLNVGSGVEVSIRELAQHIAAVVGYGGQVHFDTSKPDGAPRKLLDSGRLQRLGWRAQIGLDQGLRETYRWFEERHGKVRGAEALVER